MAARPGGVHPARPRLNLAGVAVDNPGVDQVSRPMQIALVAVVLLAGMWFTVLKPKPATSSAPVAAAAPAATPTTASSAPVAPGVKGLATAVDKARAASATSDATNAKIQSATGGTASTAAPAATATKTSKAAAPTTAAAKHTAAKSATKAKATTPAAAKAGTKAATPAATATPKAAATKTAAPAADVDPSDRLLAFLDKGKTLVILFEGNGADDAAARTAVHRTALADPKHVVSAYVPISKVGDYEAITSDVSILAAPTILVIGTDGKATPLTGYVDAGVVQQAVADARRNAAAAAK